MWFAAAASKKYCWVPTLFQHHFWICLCLCSCLRVWACICELGDRCSLFAKFIANAANHSEWYFMAVSKSIYVVIIEYTLKCNMHYTRKVICSLSLSCHSFIWPLQAKLTQLSTKGFNDAMRKLFHKFANNSGPKTRQQRHSCTGLCQ